MNVRQVVFPMPEGRQATLSFPEPMTLEAVETLERAVAQMFRSLRREAQGRQAQDTGAIEYESWALSA
ncbi:MAG: hypothetical protein IH627_01265 [Rubrivivax sp.]|nr:hypothetical protein [Rubrivivax sp.]